MRHFKKLKKSFLDDLSTYINTYTILHGSEHNAVVEDAFSAIEEHYEETRVFNAAGGFAEGTPKPTAARESAPMYASQKSKAIPIVIPEKQPTFQQNLFRIIDSMGVKDSTVYKRADIDRRLFSKIRADVDYHPSKSTAVKLCLALSLDIAQAERLLETAGYCLSMSDTADLVVRYCIEHKVFNLIEVNEALDYFDAEIL
ncbi:MAG: hypothetical protein E7571_01265 [Ruminococcaceae bacterium]|nr:hypothetical protein [Oscillospiraceae bacterium]